MQGLEDKLAGPFGKDAPVKLPEGGRKTLVQIMPWLALVFGILQLLGAWSLYHWASAASAVSNYVASVCQVYGTADCGTGLASRWSVTLWLALVVVLVDAVLLLAAFPGLRDRKKGGWNLVLYSVLLNFAYGIVSLFTNYGSKVGSFIGSLIGLVIGLWILFQIRDSYAAGKKPAAPAAPSSPDAPKS